MSVLLLKPTVNRKGSWARECGLQGSLQTTVEGQSSVGIYGYFQSEGQKAQRSALRFEPAKTIYLVLGWRVCFLVHLLSSMNPLKDFSTAHKAALGKFPGLVVAPQGSKMGKEEVSPVTCHSTNISQVTDEQSGFSGLHTVHKWQGILGIECGLVSQTVSLAQDCALQRKGPFLYPKVKNDVTRRHSCSTKSGQRGRLFLNLMKV